MRLQIISALALLFAASARAQQPAEEGVGINMESAPLGVFHVNGSDPGVYPLRLRDGSAGAGGSILAASDNEGHASRQTIVPPPKDMVYWPPKVLSGSSVSYPVNTVSKVASSEFEVPEDGFYSMDVRWWVVFNNGSITNATPNTPLEKSVTRFQLRRNSNDGQGDVVIDEIRHHEAVRIKRTAFFVLYATAKAGDKLSFYIYPEAYPAGAARIVFWSDNVSRT
jgi:hypothetical protein